MKICFLTNLPARLYTAWFRHLASKRPPRPRDINLGPGSRVLVFTCAGIGDTLTDSVVFKALAESFPGIQLTAVVHRRRRALLDHNPYVQRVFTLEKGLCAFRRLHLDLKQAGPWDAILHLRGNDPEPRGQSFLLDPNITVSVPQMTKLGWLCAHHVIQPDWDDTHGVEQTLRIARYVGADTKEPTLVYAVRPEEKIALEAKLPTLGVGPGPRLVLQIGGGRRASWRDWPEPRWAELIALAQTSLDAQILLLGGADNTDRSAAIRARLAPNSPRAGSSVIDLVGKLSLAESATLLSTARTVVSTDTGIMHISFAVGARVVAIIHCNNPAHRVGPYGYGDRHRVVQLPRPEKYRSPADADMANISPDVVMQKLQEIWTP